MTTILTNQRSLNTCMVTFFAVLWCTFKIFSIKFEVIVEDDPYKILIFNNCRLRIRWNAYTTWYGHYNEQSEFKIRPYSCHEGLCQLCYGLFQVSKDKIVIISCSQFVNHYRYRISSYFISSSGNWKLFKIWIETLTLVSEMFSNTKLTWWGVNHCSQFVMVIIPFTCSN